METRLRDPGLDALRVLACFAVVLLHTAAAVVLKPADPSGFWIANAYDAATRFCIPAFLLLSGSLVLGGSTRLGVLPFLRARTARILWPYAFAVMLYGAWLILGGYRDLDGAFLRDVLRFRLFPHLYFLQLVLGLYLLTPFLDAAIRAAPARVVVATALGLQAVVLVDLNLRWFAGWSVGVLAPGEFLGYLPTYLLGYYLVRVEARPSWRPWLWCALVLAIGITVGLTWVLSGHHQEPWAYGYNYQNLNVLLATVAIYLLVVKLGGGATLARWIGPRCLAVLSDASLGVYLVHFLLLRLLDYGSLGVRLNGQSFHPALAIPATALLVFVLCMALVVVVRRVPAVRRVF
jgi:surface polysaccharide O-acyltransferase-like enzyme